jgi:hypothetical protein
LVPKFDFQISSNKIREFVFQNNPKNKCWFWFGQEIGKTAGFGGLGEPLLCSLTTKIFHFRQMNGQNRRQVTTESL